ncbi:MAG: helix-turn-helix transcriptional regulator [Bacteroidales bacterium]|nr:helix-turn-helix transcriptional regulator [Bacteroidales bacterium]
MQTRLLQFLSAENLTQAEFAKKLGVSGPNVTHIISGRNKPSYDFLLSLANHYPALNMEWMLLGKGKMYKENAPVLPPEEPENGLFDDLPVENEDEMASTIDINTLDNKSQDSANQRKAVRVTIFYDDGSFQDL